MLLVCLQSIDQKPQANTSCNYTYATFVIIRATTLHMSTLGYESDVIHRYLNG